jgi:hypothetical protein
MKRSGSARHREETSNYWGTVALSRPEIGVQLPPKFGAAKLRYGSLCLPIQLGEDQIAS